jgi:hypothetical protein
MYLSHCGELLYLLSVFVLATEMLDWLLFILSEFFFRNEFLLKSLTFSAKFLLLLTSKPKQ